MAETNVRRRGMGDPEATCGPGSVGSLGSGPVDGAVGRGGKSLVARTRGATPRGPFRLTESRAASLLYAGRPRPRPVRWQGRPLCRCKRGIMSNLSVNRRAEAGRGPHWR
jgi:hypothetical protein